MGYKNAELIGASVGGTAGLLGGVGYAKLEIPTQAMSLETLWNNLWPKEPGYYTGSATRVAESIFVDHAALYGALGTVIGMLVGIAIASFSKHSTRSIEG